MLGVNAPTAFTWAPGRTASAMTTGIRLVVQAATMSAAEVALGEAGSAARPVVWLTQLAKAFALSGDEPLTST